MKPIKPSLERSIKRFIKRSIKTFARILLRGVFALLYRVRVKGLENYPATEGRVLMVANHLSFLDPVLLWTYLPGDPAFAINPRIAGRWWVRPALSFIPVLPMEPNNPLAVRGLIARLKEGKSAVIFPEGRITVTGGLMKVYDGPGLVADRVGATLLPVRLDGPQYTPFSRLRCQVRLRRFPPMTITVLPPRAIDIPESITGTERRRRIGMLLSDLMADLLFFGSDTRRTLYQALLDAQTIHGPAHVVAEDIRREPLTYRQFLLRTYILGHLMAKDLEQAGERETRVGLLLPTATTTAVAFFGLHRHGRVPTMLNFSMGVGGMLSTVVTAEVQTVYTSRRFVTEAKLTDDVAKLAAQVRIRYLEDLAEDVGFGLKFRGALAARFPRLTYRRPSDAPGPDDPAVVLFTSGSEGTPKGVVLSHANLISNIEQLKSHGDFRATDIVLNALPTFHSFGFTIGTLLPMLSGMKVFFYPSPLHYRIIPELIYETNATLMFGTNTFLSGYARHAHPYDFRSLRYVFAGAEKLQADTRRTWMERFGVRIFEGYGATETAPVLSFNTPMGNRPGSVGRLLPGVEHRLEPVSGVEGAGRLWVRGPNIMLGYLLSDAPGKLRPLETDLGPGWYDTGDIVNLDEDGYLWIQGRAKRFAKIGGEMVSLTALEAFAHRAWPNFSHAVVAIPHPQKGEQLVLVTECPDVDRPGLLALAKEEGLGEIGLPKRIVLTEKIPLIGTGKTDYAGVKALAGHSAGGER
uniref:Acyl-[acyl-carrier-protein]-phospholipid O-acyltransferase / long-chain-fatty-acid--[acyl-carrier-protein] ligase n=1 Tax=Candidatus Kentrum eta TaxID=2126337 RepID=A0A450UCD9_9GAMM|nr:MAG: acyl-[acyl-carrier-protein]-phospholipid O-acyltransferase / long-chain-fatty-acid--[acyl-carrier-protein] ligase [Candidatus Kentron sp. H]VFJ90013.1 MAG: acyl-[acyl-carrier-protein]-phospholipid O-acyltransferase / long-chain-fatty-acid--[acyl-carrier-protein] ligase [Candidatus Kentron sp. H]VFJ96387.1 MAG: acyl-[acyl-carrier-protein]-phospholipid O-acyltransferase / long-chain-fatty-acid--[acyl-carrier-protein] ligase [Candidatus Kentron sp. H]